VVAVAETITGAPVKLVVPAAVGVVKIPALAAQASLAKASMVEATQVVAALAAVVVVKAGSVVTLPSAVTALLVTAVQVQLTHSAPDRTSLTQVAAVAQVLQAALWALVAQAAAEQAAIPA